MSTRMNFRTIIKDALILKADARDLMILWSQITSS